ncbi:hypothetical protein DFH08DRAFT_635071, partial [Mycena albidolilacea]
GLLLDTPFEEGLKVVQTNFFGFVRPVKSIVPLMAKCQHSTVLAIDSILGEIATPFQGFHNASKAALHYTETLRMECEPLKALVASESIKSKIATRSTSRWRNGSNTSCEPLSIQLFPLLLSRPCRFQSQTKNYGVMDTDEFAVIFVWRITSSDPPQCLSLGGFSTRMWLLKWLPRTTAQALIWA